MKATAPNQPKETRRSRVVGEVRVTRGIVFDDEVVGGGGNRLNSVLR